MVRQEWFHAFAVFFGHGAFWTYCFNALHSVPLPRSAVRTLERLFAAVAAAPLLALPWWAGLYQAVGNDPGFRGYRYFCWGIGGLTVVCWIVRKLHSERRSGLIRKELETLDIGAIHGQSMSRGRWRALAHFPGNEIEQLHVQQKLISIANLPDCWEGVTVLHLTDLHLTGRMTKPFYDHALEQARAMQAEMVVITGDIIENVGCLDWLDSTIGALSAPLGVYFILGNHDKRMPDVSAVRERLEGLGLIDLGGKARPAETPRGPLLIAGNERPWFGPAPTIQSCHPDALRLALVHTPDQFNWVVKNRFHLALAGHTHGGQIRFPVIGPVICPSYLGCRYASGVFQKGGVVMHVSRGLGAMHPIRLNCPPEITLLKLTSATD
jgi:predicted MPP superfamily phosphohydrolase